MKKAESLVKWVPLGGTYSPPGRAAPACIPNCVIVCVFLQQSPRGVAAIQPTPHLRLDRVGNQKLAKHFLVRIMNPHIDLEMCDRLRPDI